jgi:predicted TPR repeat methyltransferase
MSSKMERRKKKQANRPILATGSEGIALAIRRHQEGRIEDAAKVYRQVLAQQPKHGDALHFLGVAEHQMGRSDSALGYINRAIEVLPEHPDVHNNRGNILKQLGRIDEAESAYRRAIELRPDDVNALCNLGTVQRERGALESAIAAFREVISLDPAHAPAWQNLGNALGALNQFEEALAAHREAMRLSPKSADSFRHLGAMYYAIGRIDNALEIYRQWLTLFPSDPQAHHLIAACTGQQVPERASDAYVREAFNQFAASFDSSLARLQYRAPTLIADAVREVFGDSGAKLAVLDAGCGTGLCGPLLRPHARLLVGVDLSENMVERARERRAYDRLEVAELTEFLSNSSQAYQLIVSADTLVYFGALEEFTRHAVRALEPQGLLMFTTERSSEIDAPEGYKIHPHGRYSHTQSYLLGVLKGAGFSGTSAREVTLRKEAGKWVDGWLVTARVASVPSSP